MTKATYRDLMQRQCANPDRRFKHCCWAFHVHHIIPHGPDECRNYICFCAHCHPIIECRSRRDPAFVRKIRQWKQRQEIAMHGFVLHEKLFGGLQEAAEKELI